jgi:hypothetical protein
MPLETGEVRLDARNLCMDTPLLTATKTGDQKIVKLLVETSQVDLAATGLDGKTAFSWLPYI